MLVVDPTVTVKCKTAIKALYLYFENRIGGVMLNVIANIIVYIVIGSFQAIIVSSAYGIDHSPEIQTVLSHTKEGCVQCHFQQYFSYMVEVSFILLVEKTRVFGENHRPTALAGFELTTLVVIDIDSMIAQVVVNSTTIRSRP